MAFVVDASLALAWHFEDEGSEATDALLARTIGEPVVVPSHWLGEVANAALVGERRGRATIEQTARFRGRLAGIAVETDDAPRGHMFERILPLARAHGLTVYDALYLELAERRGLPLATLDRDLARAARQVGVTVLGDSE